jgi:membrane protease YdiL (CAAX protease family)
VSIAPSPGHTALTLRDVFLGREGLRAGWSLLLYLSLVYSLAVSIAPIAHRLIPHPAAPSQQRSAPAQGGAKGGEKAAELAAPHEVIFGEGLNLVVVLFATWIMSRLERRPISVYGTAPRRLAQNLFGGLLWGLALLSLLILALRAWGLLVFDGRLLFGVAALRYAAIWLAGFFLVAFFEEYLTRGYLQFTLARGLGAMFLWLRAPRAEAFGFWSAALLLSFAFSLGHTSNPGESPIGLASAGLIGFVFCLSLWRTGSLWWAIGFHASWDWAQSFLYGVADSGGMVRGHLLATHPAGRPILSGGATGPEGSLFILPIVALAAAVIVLTLPMAGRMTQSDHPCADADGASLH